MNDLAFDANTIIVRSLSGECKNDSAYGTVLLADAEGRNAMKSLKQFLGNATDSDALVFRSKRGGSPETTLPSLDYSRFCWRKKKRCSKRLMDTGF